MSNFSFVCRLIWLCFMPQTPYYFCIFVYCVLLLSYFLSSVRFTSVCPSCVLCVCAGSTEAHSHGAMLGEQSRCSDGAAVSAQSPVWNTSTRTVWYDSRKINIRQTSKQHIKCVISVVVAILARKQHWHITCSICQCVLKVFGAKFP